MFAAAAAAAKKEARLLRMSSERASKQDHAACRQLMIITSGDSFLSSQLQRWSGSITDCSG